MATPIGYAFYREEIARVATAHQLDPNLLAAVVWKESSFQADAFRHEPGYWDRYLANKPEWRDSNPRVVASSYGLCQVMYPTAVQLGYRRELPAEGLFVPATSLTYGARLLRDLIAWAGSRGVALALAAYNGGKGNARAPIPTRYAADVLTKLATLAAR